MTSSSKRLPTIHVEMLSFYGGQCQLSEAVTVLRLLQQLLKLPLLLLCLSVLASTSTDKKQQQHIQQDQNQQSSNRTCAVQITGSCVHPETTRALMQVCTLCQVVELQYYRGDACCITKVPIEVSRHCNCSSKRI
eukprot:gene5750-9011_t